jgi:hypothetical protein
MARLRFAAMLLALTLLLPSLASAGEIRSFPASLCWAVGPSSLWDFAGEVWSSVAGLFEKEGSSIDPFGQPKPSGAEPPATQSQTGQSGPEDTLLPNG